MKHRFYKNFLALLCMGVFMSNTYLIMASPAAQEGSKTGAGAVPNLEALLTSKAQVTVLENGLTVHILEDHRFPLVSTRLYVKAGSSYEEPQDAGISHVLEHMVFKGTEKRPLGAIAYEVEEVGGYLNAATSFDYTVYITDLPAAHWALSLDIVKDMAFHPTLDATELESEKKVILSELQMGKDSPSRRIFQELHKNALWGTPYDHPIIGYEESIMAVTVQSMRDYIAKYYQPQNMHLVVVGDVDAKAVFAEIEKLYGTLENTTQLKPITPIDASKLDNAKVSVVEGSWKKVYLGIALPVPGLLDGKNFDLDILSDVIGGGATSYLYKKYEYDKQLVDDIFLANYSFARVGMLYFVVELEPKNVEEFWKLFVADLSNLTTEVFSEKDLARAKFEREDAVHRSKETIGGIAASVGYKALFLGGEQGEKNMLHAYAGVDKAQLQAAIDQWIVPERVNVSALVPKGVTLPDLAAELKKTWPAKDIKKTAAINKGTETPQIIDLGQQRTLLLIPDTTLPYTTVNLYFTGGNALSGQNEGLASLASSVLTAGTQSMTTPQIEEYLAERASGLSADSGMQTFWISTRQPSRFNSDILALLKDILTTPTFSAEEVDREKKNHVALIRSRDDRPTSYLFSELGSFFFGETHPYGFKNLGDIEAVEAYTREDIVNFWKKQAQQPWVLSVAGDFDKEAIIAFAKSLPVPTAKSPNLDAPLWGKEYKRDLTMADREQAHLLLTFPTVLAEHEDAAALELLQLVLSGQSGILFNELREKKGLAYTTTALQQFFPLAGFFMFYIGTSEEKLEQSREGFVKVIEDVQKNLIPEAALKRAINQMEGDYYRGRQSLSSRSNEGAMRLILGQELDFRKKTIEKAKKLTVEDIRKVAQKYLSVDKAYVITLKP